MRDEQRRRERGVAVASLVLVVLVGAAALAGCDTASPDATAAPAPTGPFEGPLPGAGPTSHTAFTSAFGRSRQGASGTADLAPTGLRFGVHRRYDRVVVHLRGEGAPGWRARYAGPRQDLTGTATLQVDVLGLGRGAAAAPTTWVGSTHLAPQTGHVVTEVRRGARHRRAQRILIGVDARRPFRVFALEHPARVVVDVRRPAPPRFRGPLNGVPPLHEAAFPRGRGPDDAIGSADARLSPTNLRMGFHRTFERLVLTLRGPGDPGWRAAYVDRPALPGTGAHFALAGSTTLRVRVTGVVPPTAPGARRYHGPQRFGPHRKAGPVREVVHGPVRDGAVELYLGMSAERPFRVFTVTHPRRVVVDVLR
ncbi:MAG TPA: hypothetical protein VFT70_18735 [Nocardioides sp.]|nr:hypothetical protein [Nocardioides sp.]